MRPRSLGGWRGRGQRSISSSESRLRAVPGLPDEAHQSATRRIERAVARLPDRSAGEWAAQRKLPGRGRKPNDLRFDGTNPVFRRWALI